MNDDTGNLHVVAWDAKDIFRTETSSNGRLTNIITYNVTIPTIICVILLLLHCFALSLLSFSCFYTCRFITCYVSADFAIGHYAPQSARINLRIEEFD
jgi:hypothetical protein